MHPVTAPSQRVQTLKRRRRAKTSSEKNINIPLSDGPRTSLDDDIKILGIDFGIVDESKTGPCAARGLRQAASSSGPPRVAWHRWCQATNSQPKGRQATGQTKRRGDSHRGQDEDQAKATKKRREEGHFQDRGRPSSCHARRDGFSKSPGTLPGPSKFPTRGGRRRPGREQLPAAQASSWKSLRPRPTPRTRHVTVDAW